MALAKQLTADKAGTSRVPLSYGDLITYLDARWQGTPSLARAQELDQALGSPSTKCKTILIGGSNGKSITLTFTAQLLRTEGLKVGTMSSPHIRTYNERIGFNGLSINNTQFTELANDVIAAAEDEGIEAHSLEILTVMALRYFVQNKVDVALLEVVHTEEQAVALMCKPLIASLTRVTGEDTVSTMMSGLVHKGTWFVTGDQTKAHLIQMQELTNEYGGNWAMPIRKIAALPYPFSQLHGRCGSIAERIAQLFVDLAYKKVTKLLTNSITNTNKHKGIRRTTIISLKEFWQEYDHTHTGRFEVLTKEKPLVVLDTSSNPDALKNILLGLRLLHYERHFKGCALIVAATKESMYNPEFIKLLKTFFSKMSGIAIICPLEKPVPGTNEQTSWDTEAVTVALRTSRVRAQAVGSFKEALELAKQSVDKKEGVICITGSTSVVTGYWNNK